MNGIIGGTSLIDSTLFSRWKERVVDTPYGPVTLKEEGDCLFLQRHGNPPMPPHRINHRANLWALQNRGAIKILSVNSVGSLKKSIKPGVLVIPQDFISPWYITTFHDETMHFTVPFMDGTMRTEIIELCLSAGIEVAAGDIYIQTIGPRLETRAEISMLKGFGDVVGMTMASEATLAIECGIPYTSLCSVDNYCNGIAVKPLTMDEIRESVTRNLKKIERIIQAFIAGVNT
jgi:5'-methylthioadenosine phosphorylase